MIRIVACGLLASSLFLSACGVTTTTPSDDIAAFDVDPGLLDQAISTGVNQTGRSDLTTGDWREVMLRACAEPVLDVDVLDEIIAGAELDQNVEAFDAQLAIVQMTRIVCPSVEIPEIAPE